MSAFHLPFVVTAIIHNQRSMLGKSSKEEPSSALYIIGRHVATSLTLTRLLMLSILRAFLESMNQPSLDIYIYLT